MAQTDTFLVAVLLSALGSSTSRHTLYFSLSSMDDPDKVVTLLDPCILTVCYTFFNLGLLLDLPPTARLFVRPRDDGTCFYTSESPLLFRSSLPCRHPLPRPPIASALSVVYEHWLSCVSFALHPAPCLFHALPQLHRNRMFTYSTATRNLLPFLPKQYASRARQKL